MKEYNNINDAREAAQKFFINNFRHSGNVGLEWFGDHCEYYSKDDPGMIDTFDFVLIKKES